MVAMCSRWATLLCVAGLIAGAQGQAPDGEFAETAPPKVNVLPDATVAPSPSEEAGVAGSVATDPKIEAIGQYWDTEAAIAAAEPDTAPESEPDDFSPAAALLNAFMALCAVLSLFFLLVYLGKRFGKRTPLLAGQQLGQVMGRVSLSPQASLHFVRTNGEVLVVGVTQHTVNLLRTFDEAEFDAEQARALDRPAPVAPETNFVEQLKRAQHSMSAVTGVDEELDTLKGDLQRLQKYIQDSARARE